MLTHLPLPRAFTASHAALLCAAIATCVSAGGAAHAQAITSQPVVQPLPSQDTQRLNRALVELAKNPRSLSALLEAGDAALSVGDLDAALGFFTRAREEDEESVKAILGLAKVYLQSGRPVAALPLFEEAEAEGASIKAVRSDKALALDMVGDQAAAQSGYARVIEASPRDDPARRRLAVSYAISGNIAAFESTLRPLIERRDFAAFRARAFGLAILGEQDRAAAITEAVMPRALAAKITPYLEFMPRLTPAQQAAAANFGIFPRAADIGRDTVAIAGYRYTGDPLASAATGISESAAADELGNQLEPAGEPFGRAAQTAAVPTMLEPAAQTVRETPKVADAFSDMAGDAATPRAPPTDQGAVDLTSFEAPIELEKPAEPEEEPPPPAHPSRVWVQLATGRDLEALGFDWRRFTRKAPEALADFTAHTVPWGQANRLLAGPLENDAAARDLVNTLQKKGLDTFRYTSPEGQEIQPLKTP